MRLQDKIAFITGSGQGIGRAIAVAYANEGARIVVEDVHDDADSRHTLELVRQAGSDGCVIAGDVSNVSDVQRAIGDAVRQMGHLDILVNNAGIERFAPFLDVTEGDYERVMNVNLKGTFFTTQAFVRHLRETARGGRVINISSVHEDLPFPNFASYCASKGGMKMLSRTLAVELGAFGITVNNIAPGAIRTPINDEVTRNPALVDQLLSNIPLARLGEPTDVAGAAVFLASSEADYMTGSTIYVDGGLLWDYSETRRSSGDA